MMPSIGTVVGPKCKLVTESSVDVVQKDRLVGDLIQYGLRDHPRCSSMTQ